jgi:hypothetical protein
MNNGLSIILRPPGCSSSGLWRSLFSPILSRAIKRPVCLSWPPRSVHRPTIYEFSSNSKPKRPNSKGRIASKLKWSSPNTGSPLKLSKTNATEQIYLTQNEIKDLFNGALGHKEGNELLRTEQDFLFNNPEYLVIDRPGAMMSKEEMLAVEWLRENDRQIKSLLLEAARLDADEEEALSGHNTGLNTGTPLEGLKRVEEESGLAAIRKSYEAKRDADEEKMLETGNYVRNEETGLVVPVVKEIGMHFLVEPELCDCDGEARLTICYNRETETFQMGPTLS